MDTETITEGTISLGYFYLLIIGWFAAMLGYMIRNWYQNWRSTVVAFDERLTASEKRHEEHDRNHAVVQNELKNIRSTVDETHDDVKALLAANGSRASK